MPAISASLKRLSFSFFIFLLWSLTVLMKQTRQTVHTIKQSIFLRCLWFHFYKMFWGYSFTIFNSEGPTLRYPSHKKNCKMIVRSFEKTSPAPSQNLIKCQKFCKILETFCTHKSEHKIYSKNGSKLSNLLL